jgi:hypothetical protein
VLRAVGEFTPNGFRHLGYTESTYYGYSGGLQSANRSTQGRRPLAYWLHLWVRRPIGCAFETPARASCAPITGASVVTEAV